MKSSSKKGRRNTLENLIEAGYIKKEEVLRYKSNSGALRCIGIAHKEGILCKGEEKPLTFTQFEIKAESKLHRPCEHTLSLNGNNLKDLFDRYNSINDIIEIESVKNSDINNNSNISIEDNIEFPKMIKKLCLKCNEETDFNEMDVKDDKKSPILIKAVKDEIKLNIPIFELSNENYSGLSHVKKILKNREIVINYMIKKTSDEMSDEPQIIYDLCLDEIKYLNTKQEIIDYLNKKFINDAEDTMKAKLEHLFSFLYPDDSKKDEKFMIYRIATYFSTAINMAFNSDKNSSKPVKNTNLVNNIESANIMNHKDMCSEETNIAINNGNNKDKFKCVGCGAFMHYKCYIQESNIKNYCNKQCYESDYNLAKLSTRGFIQVDRLIDNTPIMIQFMNLNILFHENFGECRPIFEPIQLQELADIKLASSKALEEIMQNSSTGVQNIIQSIHYKLNHFYNYNMKNIDYILRKRPYMVNFWIGTTLIGTALLLSYSRKFCHLYYLVIRHEYQNKGLGRIFLSQIEKKLMECGIQMIITNIIGDDYKLTEKKWIEYVGYKDYLDSSFFQKYDILTYPNIIIKSKKLIKKNITKNKQYCPYWFPKTQDLINFNTSHSNFTNKKTSIPKKRKSMNTDEQESLYDERIVVGSTRSNRQVKRSVKMIKAIETLKKH